MKVSCRDANRDEYVNAEWNELLGTSRSNASWNWTLAWFVFFFPVERGSANNVYKWKKTKISLRNGLVSR